MKTTLPAERTTSRAGEVARLLMVHSPDATRLGDFHVLESAAIEIGRDPEGAARLCLDDPLASRRHAVVERGPGGDWSARDLKSRNGLRVNGRSVDRQLLSDGDVVGVGTHLLIFQSLDLTEIRAMAGAGASRSILVGPSVRMDIVRARIEAVAPNEVAVLVLGDSGTGKELVARELHDKSPRREGPFVAVNAAALPEHLVESELFGHVAGAFSGATGDRLGLFAEADGGTLFLDEIGEMPVALQAKLLRALATGEIRPVGATQSRRVQTRVVAATNADLERAVDAGTFRGDLYARLLGEVIALPSLRRRREDIPALVAHFLAENGAEAIQIEPDAAETLLVHPWRFNVRELEQVIRAVAPAARGARALRREHLPERLRPATSTPLDDSAPPSIPLILRVRRDVAPDASTLEQVLAHFGGNVAKVGEFFGKDRKQIYRWAERLGVELVRRGPADD